MSAQRKKTAKVQPSSVYTLSDEVLPRRGINYTMPFGYMFFSLFSSLITKNMDKTNANI